MVLATLLLAALAGDDAAAAQALDAFKIAYKAKEAANRVGAVEMLSKTPHVKVCARLGSLLLVDVPEVRVAAAKGLVLQGEDRKHAVPLLLSGAQANAKDVAVLEAIVATLGKLKEEAGAAEVNKHLTAEKVELVKASIEAAAEIRSASSFDPLIKLLKELEEILMPRKPGEGPGFGGSPLRRIGGNPQEERARARDLQPLVQKALASMSKAPCQDAKEWESWWRENKSKYKPEK